MRGFKILDKEGVALSIKTLDEEVCDLLGVPVNKEEYCRLGRREDFSPDRKGNTDFILNTSSWYDTIGWMIASEEKSLQDVVDHYKDIMKDFLGKTDEEGNVITIEMIYPYHMKVLNDWISKGYKGLSVE